MPPDHEYDDRAEQDAIDNAIDDARSDPYAGEEPPDPYPTPEETAEYAKRQADTRLAARSTTPPAKTWAGSPTSCAESRTAPSTPTNRTRAVCRTGSPT
jgi:hypothetical protein